MANTVIPTPASGDIVATSWGAAVAAAHNGIQTGTASIPIASSNSGVVTITFPRPYAAPPLVLAMVAGAVVGWFCAANSVSTTQAAIAAWFRDTTGQSVTLPINWLAIGVLP